MPPASRFASVAMNNPTESNRIAALVAFINRCDIQQGRPAGVPDFTAADINVRISPNHFGGRILLADVDNNSPCEPFAVLTMDESATAKEISLERDLSEEDCITVDGETYVIVNLV